MKGTLRREREPRVAPEPAQQPGVDLREISRRLSLIGRQQLGVAFWVVFWLIFRRHLMRGWEGTWSPLPRWLTVHVMMALLVGYAIGWLVR